MINFIIAFYLKVFGKPCEVLDIQNIGVQSGAIAVLHTWGQNLTLHPHVHCIVPSAGVDLKGAWKPIGKR